jgi:hypothetical protein
MALTREEKQVIIQRAHNDKVFSKALLKELVRLAVQEDPDVLEKAMTNLEKKTKKK